MNDDRNTDFLLLGLLMKEPDLINDCQLIANLDKPFFDQQLNWIFKDAQKLYAESGDVERKQLMILGQERNIPMSKYTAVISAGGFREQLPDYISEVYNDAVKRHLQSLGNVIINCCQDELNGSSKYMDIVREAIEAIDKASAVQSGITLPEAVKIVIDRALRLSEGNTEDYIKTGIFSIDRLIHGFKTKTMSVIGARPSVGKSALGLTMLSNMAAAGTSCAFISVEMSEDECAERIMQMRSNVSMDDFASGRMSAGSLDAFKKSAQQLKTTDKIEIIRTTKRNIGNIRSIIRRLKNKKPSLKVIFIDYIQKLGNDREEIMKVSGILTDIATDLDVHVCALAQLNRDGAESPKIKHLKECGRIEEDAHYIILIDRDLAEQYKGEYDQDCNLFIAKNRGGRTGMATVKYNARTTKFYDSTNGDF
tara:strand:+ start:29573 stop:30841 length:1269 start_codon:yes stop_codon:yes gene_type:complete